MEFQDRDASGGECGGHGRADRLHGLATAGLGAMAVLGFLLVLPFTPAFARFSHGQRGLFAAGLVLAAAAVALLLAPVAWHGVLVRRRQEDCGTRAVGVTTVLGLAAVSLAVSAAVVLVLSYAGERGA